VIRSLLLDATPRNRSVGLALLVVSLVSSCCCCIIRRFGSLRGKCWQDEEFKVTGKKDVVPDLELTSSDDDPAEGGMSYDYDKPIQ
jgi:hypothetical protein